MKYSSTLIINTIKTNKSCKTTICSHKIILYKIFKNWHGIGIIRGSSDLFKEYLSKLLLETGLRGIKAGLFFLLKFKPLIILKKLKKSYVCPQYQNV